MKSFELWRQKKGSFLYDIQEDPATDEMELSEGRAINMMKTIAGKLSKKIKGLFNFSSLKWGQKKTMRFTIPLPDEVTEARAPLGGKYSGQTRNFTGRQVELLSLVDLGTRLERVGFPVEYQIDASKKRKEELVAESKEHQNSIISAKMAKAERENKDKTKVAKNAQRAYLVREQQAKITGQKLYMDIRNELNKEFVSLSDHKIVLNAGGIQFAGISKLDFYISLEKITESEHIAEIKSWSVSHKYSWEKSLGTQSSVWSFPFQLAVGRSAGKGGEKFDVVLPIAAKFFGGKAKARESLDRYADLHKRGNANSPKQREEFTELAEKYYKMLFWMVKQPIYKENLLKLMGFEKDLHHFMVSKLGEDKLKAYSSQNSKLYQKKMKQMYSKDLVIKAKKDMGTKGNNLLLSFYYKGEEIFDTEIFSKMIPQNKKDDSVDIRGIATTDLTNDPFVKDVVIPTASKLPDGDFDLDTLNKQLKQAEADKQAAKEAELRRKEEAKAERVRVKAEKDAQRIRDREEKAQERERVRAEKEATKVKERQEKAQERARLKAEKEEQKQKDKEAKEFERFKNQETKMMDKIRTRLARDQEKERKAAAKAPNTLPGQSTKPKMKRFSSKEPAFVSARKDPRWKENMRSITSSLSPAEKKTLAKELDKLTYDEVVARYS